MHLCRALRPGRRRETDRGAERVRGPVSPAGSMCRTACAACCWRFNTARVDSLAARVSRAPAEAEPGQATPPRARCQARARTATVSRVRFVGAISGTRTAVVTRAAAATAVASTYGRAGRGARPWRAAETDIRGNIPRGRDLSYGPPAQICFRRPFCRRGRLREAVPVGVHGLLEAGLELLADHGRAGVVEAVHELARVLLQVVELARAGRVQVPGQLVAPGRQRAQRDPQHDVEVVLGEDVLPTRGCRAADGLPSRRARPHPPR